MSRRPPRWGDKASLKWWDTVSLLVFLPLSFVYLAIMLVQFLSLGRESWEPYLLGIDVAMSVIFGVDYVIRYFLEHKDDRRAFVRDIWNVADLMVIFTPLIALRFGSSLTGLVRIVRILRLIVVGQKVWGNKARRRRGGQVKWMAVVAIGALAVAGLMVWAAETATTNSKANIKTPWDALWWAVVTMFTVGYGETYPVTPVGKVSAIVAMIAGIALFSWVTASLASWFAESGAERDAKDQRDAMQRQLSDMARQLQQLLSWQATRVEGRWEGAGGATPPLELGNVADAHVAGASEHAGAGSATADGVTREEVGYELRETKWWVWIAKSGKKVKEAWVSFCAADLFWYGLSVLMCAVALVQAYTATDEWWRAAVITIPLFGFALFLTGFRSRAGWVRWGLWLSSALLLGADLSWEWVSWALLLAGIGLIPFEVIASRRGNPSDPSSPSAPDAMLAVVAAEEAAAQA